VKVANASGRATIALAEEKRNKAKLAMAQAQQNIDKMRVTAPMMDSLPSRKTSGHPAECFSVEWSCRVPQVTSRRGANVAQVIDPKEMELAAKVGELDRNNIKETDGRYRISACPEPCLHGT